MLGRVQYTSLLEMQKTKCNFDLEVASKLKLLSKVVYHRSVHWDINPPPPQKHHTLFFAKPPLKSANCPSLPPPPIPPYILVFLEPQTPPTKNQIFQCATILLNFFILNTILSFKRN